WSPPGTGQIERILLVGETDDRPVAVGRQPFRRVRIAVERHRPPPGSRKWRTGPERAMIGIGKNFVQARGLFRTIGPEAQAEEVEPRPTALRQSGPVSVDRPEQ